MAQKKMTQIDLELFKNMMNYLDTHPDLSDPQYDRIVHGMQIKLRAMLRRSLYTIYKTSASKQARSLAREAYLNELGVPRSFRWPDCQDANVTHDTSHDW